jgi:hypothetical protein
VQLFAVLDEKRPDTENIIGIKLPVVRWTVPMAKLPL